MVQGCGESGGKKDKTGSSAKETVLEEDQQ